jgi:hypothetical protein
LARRHVNKKRQQTPQKMRQEAVDDERLPGRIAKEGQSLKRNGDPILAFSTPMG